MNGRNAMRLLARFAMASAASMMVPAATLASPIQMTPNPLGDWIAASLVTANVNLQSGETQPAPTVVFRTAVDGDVQQPSTVNFDFRFDVVVVDASVSAQSGAITIGPFLFTTMDPGFRRLAFLCGQTVNPCSVDVTFELASPPNALDVTDSNNFFGNSPGAPNQTLSSTFAFNTAPAVPVLGPAALGTGAAALLLTGGWALRRVISFRAVT